MVNAFVSIPNRIVPVKSNSNGVEAETNNHPNSVGILQVWKSQLCVCVLPVVVWAILCIYLFEDFLPQTPVKEIKYGKFEKMFFLPENKNCGHLLS